MALEATAHPTAGGAQQWRGEGNGEGPFTQCAVSQDRAAPVTTLGEASVSSLYKGDNKVAHSPEGTQLAHHRLAYRLVFLEVGPS